VSKIEKDKYAKIPKSIPIDSLDLKISIN